MTKITETDYETVEREVERWQCDHCGAVVDEDQINTVQMFEGPNTRSRDETDIVEHRCESCSHVRIATNRREQMNTIRQRWELFGETVSWGTHWGWVVGAYAIGSVAVWIAGNTRAEYADSSGLVMQEFINGTVFAAFALVVVFFVGGAFGAGVFDE